jgi:F0F1-type ATP synthase membrane subunit b/b'
MGDTNAPPAAPSTNKVVGGPDMRDEFVAGADKTLKTLDQEIADLGQKAAGYKDDAKANADKLMDDLHAKRAVAGQKLEELKKAAADAWSDTKTSVSAALHDLQEGFDNAKAKFQ